MVEKVEFYKGKKKIWSAVYDGSGYVVTLPSSNEVIGFFDLKKLEDFKRKYKIKQEKDVLSIVS